MAPTKENLVGMTVWLVPKGTARLARRHAIGPGDALTVVRHEGGAVELAHANGSTIIVTERLILGRPPGWDPFAPRG